MRTEIATSAPRCALRAKRERLREEPLLLAEGVGFEPTVTSRATTVFETAPIVHSGTPPGYSVVRRSLKSAKKQLSSA